RVLRGVGTRRDRVPRRRRLRRRRRDAASVPARRGARDVRRGPLPTSALELASTRAGVRARTGDAAAASAAVGRSRRPHARASRRGPEDPGDQAVARGDGREPPRREARRRESRTAQTGDAMTAKILAFAGSARAGSWNKKLVAIAAAAATAAGGEVTLVDLRDF